MLHLVLHASPTGKSQPEIEQPFPEAPCSRGHLIDMESVNPSVLGGSLQKFRLFFPLLFHSFSLSPSALGLWDTCLHGSKTEARQTCCTCEQHSSDLSCWKESCVGCSCGPCPAGAVAGALSPPAMSQGRDGAGEAWQGQGSLWGRQPLPTRLPQPCQQRSKVRIQPWGPMC